MIHIIIPVYNAHDDLIRCIESVRRHGLGSRGRLTLIDDASTDDNIRQLFARLKAENNPNIQLLKNDNNVGFVGTVNRGLSLSTDDVILLNSDTIVTHGWLENIQLCADSDQQIGTITPFSNNAEICSFPQMCQENELPGGLDLEQISRLISEAAIPAYPDIPTAVGFCMYIRRALLNQIGSFDEKTFGLGYGEENDFCMRAFKAGWRNVLCDDTYIYHVGGSSFDAKKAALTQENTKRLLKKHPDYQKCVESFIKEDPLKQVRALAMSHLTLHRDEPGILHICHDTGGGTETHIRDLTRAGTGGFRHYALFCHDDDWRIEVMHCVEKTEFFFKRAITESWLEFLGQISAHFKISFFHVHHICGCRDGLLSALQMLPIPYGLTLHDLYIACPTFHLLGAEGQYCDAETDPDACQSCLSRNDALALIDIRDWRQRSASLVQGAKFIMAPSQWLANTFQCYFPDCQIQVVEHGITLAAKKPETRVGVLMPDDDVPHVAVMGAISPLKGIRRLENLIQRTRDRGLKLRWILIGYSDKHYPPWQDDDQVFTVHGPYVPVDVARILNFYRVSMLVFPSNGPESFSYTLSECWAAGRPALVPPFGALAERMQAHQAGWIMDAWNDDDKILDQIMSIVSPAKKESLVAASAHAENVPVKSIYEMAEEVWTEYRLFITCPLSDMPYGSMLKERLLGDAAWNLHLKNKKKALIRQVEEMEIKRESLERQTAALGVLEQLVDTNKQLENEIRKVQEEMHNEVKRVQEEMHAVSLHMHALLSSASWRITHPIRYVSAVARKKQTQLMVLLKKMASLLLTQSQKDKAARHINRIKYAEWVQRNDTLTENDFGKIDARIAAFTYQPLISVLMPVYNPEVAFLEEAINSVRDQRYQNWELCIADDASTDSKVRKVLEAAMRSDARIKVLFRETNGHISAASNSALTLVEGEFVALMDHDDLLPPHALYMVADYLNNKRDIDIIYSDEDKVDVKGRRFDPHFKPDWNFDLFLSQNYISHLGVYRTALIRNVGGFREGFEGSQDYDLCLRCVKQTEAEKIVHIPFVLYHWRASPGSTAVSAAEKSYAEDAALKSVKAFTTDMNVDEVVTGKYPTTYRVKYRLPDMPPLISIIIPTRNGYDILHTCIESIKEKTDYPNYEILIVDNQSDDPIVLRYFKQLEKEGTARVIAYDKPFNYAAINNYAATFSTGSVLALLNNDLEVINSDWLSEMVSHVLREEIGVVGAKLYYGDGRIQHGGVITGIGGVAGHAHKYFPKDAPGAFYRLHLTQALSAVTGACMLIRREVFDAVGGLDENLAVAFNDIDFCLKVREKGFRNLWTPYAELFHHESVSRGSEDTVEKQQRFAGEIQQIKKRWGQSLMEDPAYSLNLTLDREDFSWADVSRAEKPWH
ncbi:MAG: glycosyltransferase [Mariprofundaceae bacterium]